MKTPWDEYWELGYITSFGSEFKKNYTGQLCNMWYDVFSRLKNDFKLLDIATGNGALPLLAQDYFNNSSQKGDIKGVDFANINLSVLSRYHQNKNITIELMGNIKAESLPFLNDEFDAVISQFGIEYSDIIQSFSEVNRVLAIGGVFESIIHHKDSFIVQKNNKLLEFLRLVQVNSIILVLKCLARDMGSIHAQEDLDRIKSCHKCEKSRVEINRLLAELAEIDGMALRETEFLNYVNNFFRKGLFWSIDKKLEYLDFVSNQLSVYKNRLLELVTAAVDFGEIHAFKEYLAILNVENLVVEEVYNDRNEIIAWHIRYTKSQITE